ncbi:MauE/DoxX family redox-associated membrane protein [Streptomyces sp. NPDC003038]|uniref:MauE/DoxX family redox-associated membrane protein n=1 Tax=unclassified Streptomyces TaxID=2593676 RepID=UPI0033AE0499
MVYVIDTGRILLGLVFFFSFAGKVRGRVAFLEFRAAVGQLAPALRGLRKPVAASVVTAEAVTVAALAVPATAVVGFALSALLLSAFTAGLVGVLRHGVSTSCHCFGSGSGPVAHRHVVRNALLGLVALTGFCAHLAAPDRAVADPAAALLLSAGVAALLALVTITLDQLAGVFASAPAEETR